MRTHLLRQLVGPRPAAYRSTPRSGHDSLPRIWALLVATSPALTPALVEACATCISTPFGDRSYNWPYLVLILVPFAVTAVIGGVMMRVTGAHLSDLRPWLARILHPVEPPDAPQEETT
jgi:hypothetical protein